MTLRILHTESSLGWGGQEIRVLTEAHGVARAGHEVMLAAPREARIFAEAPRFGVPVTAAAIARKGARGFFAMRHALAHGPFDVVNTHSSTDSWLAALACATLGGAPVLVRTRHISAALPRNRATRWLYGRSARIVTTGERLRAQVIAEAGVDPARVVSIPTGIDLDRYKHGDRLAARAALGLRADAKIVGIVATLRSWKGHSYLLKAVAAMRRPEVLLAVVGDGPQRAALEQLAATLGIAEQVRFAGDQADVTPWLNAFDVFCLPSYANEGVPQALMQAMACALPVITTPVGSIDEIVEAEVTGIIVPPQNEVRLRVEISKLLDDGERRRELGAAARERARARFGEALMVERMVAIFNDAVVHRG
ncbi:MAG TPA: glycosyltransferase family 4 protein [Usitatibacter sp.]